MEHELGSLKPKLAKSEYRRALKNQAVAHCQKNWERVYRSVYKEKGSGALARIEASEAFRSALPLLVGEENIRDFIGCVTFGFASGILYHDNTTKLLYAAQIAFNTAGPRTRNGTEKAPKIAPKSSGSSPLAKKQLPPPPSPVENGVQATK